MTANPTTTMQAIATTFKLLLHLAGLAFVLWLVTGGPLWKGRPADLPAIQTFLPRE